ESPGEELGGIADPAFAQLIDHVASSAFLLEGRKAGMIGDAGAVEPLIGSQIRRDLGERGDKIGYIVELLGIELRAALPLAHPLALGNLAEVGWRDGILQQAANPCPGTEAAQVRRRLRTCPLPMVDVAAKAAPLQDAAPVGQWISAQDVGRSVRRDADVGQT